jgi:mono/diheme cytochrome c family protein
VSLLRYLFTSAVLGAMFCSGCDLSHGKPGKDSETLAPDQIMDFATLYSQNCAGCHGTEGRGGAAIALADPVYLGIADDGAVRRVTANGVPGTAMPAFAQSAGGMLTDKQIEVITSGIRSRWSKPGILEATNPPSYSAKSAGNIALGAIVFKSYCESCHGADRKAARSQVMLFWNLSAVRACARLSLRAARNSAPRIGAEISPANRCPSKRSRMLLRGLSRSGRRVGRS